MMTNLGFGFLFLGLISMLAIGLWYLLPVPMWLAYAISTGLWIGTVIWAGDRRASEQQFDARMNALLFVSLGVFAAAVGKLVLFRIDSAHRLLLAIVGRLGARPALLALVLITAIVSSILYWLRINHLLTYAYLEIFFAFVSCYISAEKVLQNPVPTLSDGVALTGSAYLLVRGLTNRRDGTKTRSVLPAGRH